MTYVVMGFSTVQQDENAPAITQEQQTADPPLAVIYTTEDENEAKSIVNGGGYVGQDDVWYVAREYYEEVAGEVIGDGAHATLSKSAMGVPPDNSSATIDDDGRVRTDAGKRPIEQADVDAMADDQKDFPAKSRTIIN